MSPKSRTSAPNTHPGFPRAPPAARAVCPRQFWGDQWRDPSPAGSIFEAPMRRSPKQPGLRDRKIMGELQAHAGNLVRASPRSQSVQILRVNQYLGCIDVPSPVHSEKCAEMQCAIGAPQNNQRLSVE